MQNLALAAAQFESALKECGATKAGQELFQRLLRCYQEESRHYHNLDHIAHCLQGLEHFAQHAQHSAQVTLALWFHDAVYNAKAKDNEAKSAQMAREELLALEVSKACVDRICAHIIATRDHKSEDPDAKMVIDLDLAILAASPARYDRFEEEVRREYAHVPGFLFKIGRKKVLKHFITREHIYNHRFARELWEEPARANLRRALGLSTMR